MFQSLLDQANKDAATIQAKDLKIQALVLELSLLRRVRYGAKSEVCPAFRKTCLRKRMVKTSAHWKKNLPTLPGRAQNHCHQTQTSPRRPPTFAGTPAAHRTSPFARILYLWPMRQSVSENW